MDTHRPSEALGLLDKALLAHPEDGDCHLLAGRIRLGQKDYAKAREHFLEIRLSNPFNPEIHAALKSLYEELAGDLNPVVATKFN